MATSKTDKIKLLTADDFTQHPDIIELVRKLKERFGETFEDLVISDTLDAEGNQYVHLVQEGGGVLGIALVGYSFILETVGIRFLRLAGTSAGAINTMLMAATGDKQSKKSEKILDILCRKNLFDFVDGHPFIKLLIKKLITTKNYFGKVKRRITYFLLLLLTLIVLDFLSIGWEKVMPQNTEIYLLFYLITGLMLTLFIAVLAYAISLLIDFKDSGFGINSGNDFLDWIKSILNDCGIDSIRKLNEKTAMLPPGLHIRNGGGDPNELKGLFGDITVISSEIISQNKIEFPKMWPLFTLDPDNFHPAEFVRASMSIPLFFKSYEITNIPADNKLIIDAWKEILGVEDNCIPQTARFIDGGIVSNFPISIFYNPKVVVPRLPTFGIELDDTDPKKQDQLQASSILQYLYRIFNTVRFNYDKDFLLKNAVYKKGIGSIKVFDFNWLNFNLSDKEKIELFIRGAQSAALFLLGDETKKGFDWQEYKMERAKVHQEISPSYTIH